MFSAVIFCNINMAYPYKYIIAIVQIPAQNYTGRQCITVILLYAVLCWCKTSPNCDFSLHNDIQEWYALWKQKKPFVRSENSNFYCLQPYSDIISTHLFCRRTSKQPLDVCSYTLIPYVHKVMVVRPKKNTFRKLLFMLFFLLILCFLRIEYLYGREVSVVSIAFSAT